MLQWIKSLLETCGCVMTMDNSNIKHNFCKLYYNLLVDYIVFN